jgi:excisionase family DNA binding protein
VADRLLTIEELAAYLGLKKATLREWCWQKRIPYVKLGRAVRFRLTEIDGWLSACAVAPATPRPDLGELLSRPRRSLRGRSRAHGGAR